MDNLSPPGASLQALLGDTEQAHEVMRRRAGKEDVWKGWESPEAGALEHFTNTRDDAWGPECYHRTVGVN